MMRVAEDNLNNVYDNGAIGYGLPLLSGTAMDVLLPMYNNGSVITNSLPAKTAVKADSGLTYALPVSRKRSRDSISSLISFPNGQIQCHQSNNRCRPFTFLGEDIMLQIQQQQLEVDRFIIQHESSSAQYILQQYTAASGGQKLQNSIRNTYAMGK